MNPLDDSASGFEVRMLGPFELRFDGRVVSIGSVKQRAVLGMLALNAGRVVSADGLCDLVWDEDQPASPTATLQSLISRLRRTLSDAVGGGDAARDVLRTREPGWVLDIGNDAVDALHFEALTARARLRAERGEWNTAEADLTAAINLWRGAALVDVVEAGYLTTQATRLDESRLDAVENLAEAQLANRRVADALDRLERHVAVNPLRERGWALLIEALYRLGRQAAALGACQRVRAILRDELGIEPSPMLTDIEQRVLRQDPDLAGPTREPPVPAASASHDLADFSVVVVEDHDFQRRTLVQLLRGLGVGTVSDAANGADALRLLEEIPVPDVIICDIDMPGMDGVEFVSEVAQRQMASAMVIASGLEANVLRAVEGIGESQGLRVLGALEKPVTARGVRDVLSRYTRLDRPGGDAREWPAPTDIDLRDALESGQLTVRFAPRIDLTTGTLSSAEAIAYLPAAEGDAIPPSTLLRGLARHGLLPSFVDRLVADSCALLERLADAGRDKFGPLRVSIDVSRLRLDDPSLADSLAEMVQRGGQDPRSFVFSVDDVTLAQVPTTAVRMLTRLRVKGFGLSMSNCGAGPSWLHQLARLPLSELKLDPRLVSGVSGDPKRTAALDAALESIRDAGLPVVADGCDSAADFDLLLALGCSEAQGRCVAQPMNGAGIVEWSRTAGAGGDAGHSDTA